MGLSTHTNSLIKELSQAKTLTKVAKLPEKKVRKFRIKVGDVIKNGDGAYYTVTGHKKCV